MHHAGPQLLSVVVNRGKMSDSDYLPLSTFVFEEDQPLARLLEIDDAQATEDDGCVVNEAVAKLLDSELSGLSSDEVEAYGSEDDYIPSASDVPSSDEDCTASASRKRQRLSQAARYCVQIPGNSTATANTSTIDASHSSTIDATESANTSTIDASSLSTIYATDSANASTINATDSANTSTIDTATPVRLAYRSMKGKNGYIWSVNPIVRHSARRSAFNTVRVQPGPIFPRNFSVSPENYFKLLVDDGILETIVQHTNNMLTLLRENLGKKYKATFYDTDVIEIVVVKNNPNIL